MADAIICLGDVFYKPRTIENMKCRTEKSVELYKQKRAAKIIFTGGFKTRKDLSEAEFMANYAIELGASENDVILEEKANTTIGNAFYCKEIMEKEELKSAIIITSPHHLRRAIYIFKKIIPNRILDFEKSKNNLGFFESIPYHIDEIWSLLKLKIKGIDFSRV